jgi:hypothetical protein
MDNNKIDDIVDMLDNFMANGGGHMNVDVSPEGNAKSVQTAISSDCNCKDMACAVPTMHQGIDDEE